MAKTLSQFMTEVSEPKSEDEKAFKDKHVVSTTADANGNGDDVFKASKVKKDKTKNAGYHDGEDTKVYEAFEADVFKELLEATEEDVEVYMEMYTNTINALNDQNRDRLQEMVRSGDVEKVIYFLEAVNY